MKLSAKAAAMDRAEARTAAVMAAPKATLQERMAAAEQEKQAGAGLWSREHDLEAG